jgi:hypothetical protein
VFAAAGSSAVEDVTGKSQKRARTVAAMTREKGRGRLEGM